MTKTSSAKSATVSRKRTQKGRPLPIQLELPIPSGRGGRRAGAGRPPAPGRRRVPHRRRPAHRSEHPVHVTLRSACRARRRGGGGGGGSADLDALLARVDALPLQVQTAVARAFTLFFLLINTAEQVHRVRRRRSRPAEPPQPASPRWAMQQLRERGVSSAEVANRLRALRI